MNASQSSLEPRTTITDEQRQALANQPGRPLPADDVQNQAVYYIYSEELHHHAMRALQESDLAAVRAGIADRDAGRVFTRAEVDAEVRSQLGFSLNDE